jgi:hypothetical protein
MSPKFDDQLYPLQEQRRIGDSMTRLIVVSLLFILAAGFPRTSAATNYREYKKFDPPNATGQVLRRHHDRPKERWNYRYPDEACGAHP